MKGIIIFLLTIIVSVMGYNQYQKYQRFHPKNVNYISQNTIDNSYHDPKVVMNYYEAIEVLNGYIISQWSSNRIDVRNPKKDNKATEYAINEYQKKLGRVKYYEGILQQSTSYKTKGLSNGDIQFLEQNSLTPQALSEQNQKKEFQDMFKNAVSNRPLKKGDQGPWVHEFQKYLITKGYSILLDGKFKSETHNALENFEFKNQLYPDGILDILTLNVLIKSQDSATKALLVIQ